MPDRPDRVLVRRRSPTLIASPIAAPGLFDLPDGRQIDARVGDYRIVYGQKTVDVVAPSRFAEQYEPAVTGDLLLDVSARRRLEVTTGVGSTQTPEALIAAVERLAKIGVGEIPIEFTPGQLEEIAFRARKRGRSVKEELKAVVDRIKDELFWRGG